MRKLLLCLSLLAGCQAQIGSMLSVPKTAAATCKTFCVDMGLQLSSVVVMANNVGCVCSPEATTPPSTASAGAAGMATILMQQQQDQQRLHPR